MTKAKFTVSGMSCAACALRVEKAVRQLEGVRTANVNLLTNSMQVEFAADKTGVAEIISQVDKVGYTAEEVGGRARDGRCDSSFAGGSRSKSRGQKTSNGGPEMLSETAELIAKGMAGTAAELRMTKKRLIGSAVFGLPLFYIAMGHMMHWPLPNFLLEPENCLVFGLIQLALSLAVCLINRSIFLHGLKNLYYLAPNMDSLIAVGAGAAMLYGWVELAIMGYQLGHCELNAAVKLVSNLYFESAGTILLLIMLGNFLEIRAKGKSSEVIGKLVSLVPPRATVLVDGVPTEKPVGKLGLGDIILVKAGEVIAADGLVVEGSGTVDESMLTGESLPVCCKTGDNVNGATLNLSGYLHVKVTRLGEDSMLAQIIRAVDEATLSKAPIAKIADKVSGIFVPVVIGLAVLTGIGWLLAGAAAATALNFAICVLVISCPCALGLATPTAITVGAGVGAGKGVLFKSAAEIERLAKVDFAVLDKTGTITYGRPEVTDVLPNKGVTEAELLQLAAALEVKSEHPLAGAIMAAAAKAKIDHTVFSLESFAQVPGGGIKAKIQGTECLGGNRRLLEMAGIDLGEWRAVTEGLAGEGKTPLIFSSGGVIAGVIAVADVLKPESAAAVKCLRHLGLATLMITGDNKYTADVIGKAVEVDEVIAEVLPQEKAARIAELQKRGKIVVMVGDGINDAPALVQADVGVAIGGGTDIAIEAADVVLMHGKLMDLVVAVKLGRAVLRNIKENLFWAFAYNVLGIPLAAGIFYPWTGIRLTPMLAALAMSCSSIFVVTNALRLRLWRGKLKK